MAYFFVLTDLSGLDGCRLGSIARIKVKTAVSCKLASSIWSDDTRSYNRSKDIKSIGKQLSIICVSATEESAASVPSWGSRAGM